MSENFQCFLLYPRFRPVRMLGADERGFVAAHGPIKPVSNSPPLFRVMLRYIAICSGLGCSSANTTAM